MTFEPTLKSVERLVKRIVAGEAVFFVGAGFSLDSEPNSSARLIRRLVVRFAAITETLAARTNGSSAPKLRDGLGITFGLAKAPMKSEEMLADKAIDQLKQVYYNINDWMCSAFTALLQELEKADATELQNIRERERELLAPYDKVPLDDFAPAALAKLGIHSGKALFLETMGFAKTEVFGGDPRVNPVQAAISSYGSRLLNRHFIIARLAREGVAPLILTTNFDLLLEGACRAAGFEVGDARVAPADVDAIHKALESRCAHENKLAAKWDEKETERSRQEFMAITAWTNRFHVGLLREFALMEAVARNQRSGRRVQEFRSPTFYFPLLDRPGWGAWGAVVELALRRMAELIAGSKGDDRKNWVGDSEFPMALVKATRDAITRTALVLRGPGASKISRTSVRGLFRRVHEWDMGAWRGAEAPPAGTPPADQIWRWSFLPMADLRSESPCVWFGEPDESRTEGAPQAAESIDGRAVSTQAAVSL